MRTAGLVDHELNHPSMEPSSASLPSVPGFTPINQRNISSNDHEVVAPIQETGKPRNGNIAKPAATVSSQVRKIKSTNSSVIESDSKKQIKKPRQRNMRPVRQHASNRTQDVSKALVIRKFGPSTSDCADEKTTEAVNQSFIKGDSGYRQPMHAGLGQAYHRAYERRDKSSSSRDDCHLGLRSPGTLTENLIDGLNGPNPQVEVYSQEHPFHGPDDCPEATQDLLADFTGIFDDATEAGAYGQATTNPAQCNRFTPGVENYDLGGEVVKRLDRTVPTVRSTLRPSADSVPKFKPRIHNSTLFDISSDADVLESLTDDNFDEIINSARAANRRKLPARACSATEDSFDDEDLDTELLSIELTTPQPNHGESPPFTQRTPPVPRLQWMPPTQYTPLDRGQLPIATSPTTLVPRSSPLAEKSPNVQTSNNPLLYSYTTPFTRPPFPASLLLCSQVSGLSPKLFLRTCFRIGEAVNAASLALRHSNDAIIELYCRVRHSHRNPNSHKQFFELCDLFHSDRPPFLHGEYAIWKGVDLWEYDSRQFLGENSEKKMARVVGRIKRGVANNNNNNWQMNILNIWATNWEDVDVVRGVVSS